MVRKILILSVSAGAGHVRAAQAVEAAAKASRLEATHIDLLTLVPRRFRELYGQQYIKLVETLPQLWSYLYSKSDRPSRDTLIGKLKRSIEKLNTRKLGAEIARLKPDVILCTHFLPAELERTVCAAELGVDPGKFTALLMAGGAGVGALDALASRLTTQAGEQQLIVLAGRNQQMLGKLQALAGQHPGKLFPLGFTTTVERVMTAADLVITKPGGLSVSECLAKGKPMLLVSPIPGQEERNADYLLEGGAGVKAIDAATLEFKFARLLADPTRLAAMGAAARSMGRANAAGVVVGLLSAAS